MRPPKSEISYPCIGQIRLGLPKTKEGYVGKDLNEKMRVVFHSGNRASADIFLKNNPGARAEEGKPILVDRIRAMFSFSRIDQSWTWYNEAHSAGRMIARADHDHYITLRDGANGAYLIQDGEPYKKFTPGDVVEYTDGRGKKQTIKLKPAGRLRLFLPELGRFVSMEMKTTGFYHCSNIQNNLMAIQAVADALNGGNVAGIPFYIYRQPSEVTWNKPDGSAARVTKWLVQIEIDSEWVAQAVKRLSSFALTGSLSNAPLLPEIAGADNPDDDGEDDEPIDASFAEKPQEEAPKEEPPQEAEKPLTLADAAAFLTPKGKRLEDLSEAQLRDFAGRLERGVSMADYDTERALICARFILDTIDAARAQEEDGGIPDDDDLPHE